MKIVAYNIIKLLLQYPLTTKLLLKYLNINIITLKITILEINQKLVEMKLPLIKEKNKIYSLDFSKKQRKLFYESCIDYSREQRYNYLLLKILVEKNINLEQERHFLNISRSTISRDFLFIKKFLYQKKMIIITQKWKGCYLEILNEENRYEALVEILMIFYSDYNYLPGIIKKYLLEIQPKDLDKMLEKILKIYDLFNIQIGDFTIKYICTLKTCIHLSKKFYLKLILNYIRNLEKKLEFRKIYFEVHYNQHLNATEALYVSIIIYDTIYKKFYLEKKFSVVVDKYCEYFHLILSKNEQYFLTFFFHLSIFRYNNKIFNVKNVYLEILDLKVIKHVKKVFANLNLKVLYGDLLEISEYTKKCIISFRINSKKSILILKREVNQNHFIDLKNILDKNFPNFLIEIKSNIYINFENFFYHQYDLILSDTKLESNIKYRLFPFDKDLIFIINNYLLELHLEIIN